MKMPKTKTLLGVLCLLVLGVATLTGGAAPPSASPRKVYVIPISGNVEPGLAAFVKRSLRDIAGDSKAVFVFEMDTFGGRVDSALQMVDTLLNVPKGETIAFVTKKAISAGALIALSCQKLVMKPHTTIGDCAPISFSKDGAKMMGEKFQSPLRAQFRTLARRNGFPEALAEAMVTAGMEVYEIRMAGKTRYLDAVAYKDLSPREKKAVISKKTVVSKGELLTMDDAEARALGFSRMSAASVEELLQKMDITDFTIIRIKQSWSATLVRFIVAITPILMLIGIAALYLEIKSPGFGVPGTIGILCLALVFLNQYLIGLADNVELLLILTGIVLLGLELFVIPGFGVAGFTGIGCIGVGMILSMQDFVIPNPSLPWQQDLLIKNTTLVLGSFIGAFFISMFVLRYVFPRLSIVARGPYLDTTLEAAHADSAEARKTRKGDTGVAFSFLRPSGKADFNGEILDVIAQGEFIERGTPIRVTEIRGNRIIVQRSSE